MGYVEKTLAPGEHILLRAHFNWTSSVVPVLWCLIGLTPLFYAAVTHLLQGAPPGDPAWLYGICAIPAFFGVYVFIAHLIMLRTTEIVITSSRFVYKTGLISRDTKEVSLNKIEEINLRQTIFGRLFGYGFITLRGTGVGVIQLPGIDEPMAIRRCIETAKAQLRDTQNLGPKEGGDLIAIDKPAQPWPQAVDLAEDPKNQRL